MSVFDMEILKIVGSISNKLFVCDFPLFFISIDGHIATWTSNMLNIFYKNNEVIAKEFELKHSTCPLLIDLI